MWHFELDLKLELHHRELPQRYGGNEANEARNLEIVDRWSREAMVEFRHAGWDLAMILQGPNSYIE